MATWPTSVATDAILYIAVNLTQTTLAGTINNSVTTITLASTTGFPTAGAVTIDNEVIFYTGISGADLTGCTRGSDGTTAASHSSGVPVGATVVAAHHNLLKNEIIAIESSLNLTASVAIVTNGSGRLAASAVTATELGYLSGVTSAIQTQINAKVSSASPTFTGTVTIPTPFTLGAVSVTATGTELNYVAGVTSAIQSQLNLKAPLASPTFTGTVTTAGIAMGANKITGLADGTASTDAAAFGQLKVFQIVSGTSTTAFSTTSSTFQTTNLTATITPSSSSHRIIIIASGGMQGVTGNHDGYYSLFRDSTNLGGSLGFGDIFTTSGGSTDWPVAVTFLDSPASTSALVYSVKILSANNTNTIIFGPYSTTITQSIILIEVA